MDNSRYLRCRVCLTSHLEAELQSIFEETGEKERKFEEITGIDISKERNKNPVMMCENCLQDLEKASDFRDRSICAKVTYFLIDQESSEEESSSESSSAFEDSEDENDSQSTEEDPDENEVGYEKIKGTVESDFGEEIIEIGEQEDENSSTFCDENMNAINSIISELFEAENIENLSTETIEDNLSSETGEDHEVRKIMEAEDSVVAPLPLYSEVAIEVLNSELNIKEPEVQLKKVNTSEMDRMIEKKCETESQSTSRIAGHERKVDSICREKLRKRAENRKGKKNRGRMAVNVKKVFKCKICSKGFPHNSWLKQHMLTHEFSNDSTANPKRPFKCRFEGCGKYFKLKNHLEKHEKTHNPIKVKCSICSKGFKCDDTLQKHINAVHLKKKTFKCDRCSKIFNFRANFLKHFRHIHIEKKNSSRTFPEPAVMTPNHCKICFRLCSSRSNLKKHIEMVHEKKRNFACDLCSKTFYFKRALRNHKTTHIFTNDDTTNASRPHRCDFDGCGKYFKTKHDINNHKKRMHKK